VARSGDGVCYGGDGLSPAPLGAAGAIGFALVADERGTWRTFGEETIYDNRWVRLGLVDVEAPTGERWDYHVVHLPRIAIALIVNGADEVLMLWRYRFATDQWGYELLGGLVDEGEQAERTAAREAAEESGWAPVGSGEKLISFEPLPGNVTAPMDVFLWREFERVGEPTDAEEVGRVEWVPLARVPELAARGELLGAGTLVALLYFLASRGAPASG
jgi:ADP-ribose pyrophosphatase